MNRWLARFFGIAGLLVLACSLSCAGEGVEPSQVSPVMILPFVLMLGAIAVAPFINRHWWEANYPAVSVSLGLLTVLYYIFVLHNVPRLLATLYEYVSFIALIGSLFVVSGGIHFRMRGRSTPLANVALLGFGAIVSNLVGTTGASMLLIRPYIRVNRYRIRPYHVIFFIFLVSNIGGALTPIGDPPLFLGYLKGIPFFWVFDVAWQIWLLAVLVLLGVFAFIDFRSFRKLSPQLRERVEETGEGPRFDGLSNLGFLLAILVSVFIEHPLGLREVLMVGAAAGSYYTTPKRAHAKNEFNFAPIKEVAILFIGIFATMVPALDWLTLHSQSLGIESVGQYYWGTGILSSFLDNAPTYLNFLTAAFGLFHLNLENVHHMEQFLTMHWRHVQAISIGAVFFGACTYIGNGPNFMVKSIAEQSGVAMPSFFGYVVKYTFVFLVPLYAIIWLFFFRA
ncbi:MAG: sodium:proton antiporter [Bacteroidota bacterium]|nr:sodium:proton antiporter [Bacteroidota bacterium]